MTPSASLAGKTAVITGATAGIGLYSLLALAGEGADVIGVGRNEARILKAEALIREKLPDAQVKYLLADLSIQSQVRNLAVGIQDLLKERGIKSLDILVNNAGVYAQHLTRTPEGIELTLAVNHLAAFLLTHELLPVLTSGTDQRVITMSSFAHIRASMNVGRLNNPFPYVGILAYARSKLANILFTREFNRRMSGSSVHAFAMDPGLVNTEIALKERGVESQIVWSFRRKKGSSPEIPAQTVLYLCREKSILQSPHNYWRDTQPKQPGRNAMNDRMAAELWNLSCELCGIQNTDPQ